MTDAPVSYSAEEAGKLIGKSAYWMQKKARAREIPFTLVGSRRRWTPEHLEQILRDGEQRPETTRSTPRRKAAAASEGRRRLQAREPKRNGRKAA